jgi:toxin HigB-1
MMPWMIRSFRDREAERLFNRERRTKFASTLRQSALRKLLLLDAAETLDDVRVPPGNRLEKLAGDREDQYSIRINDKWRVCFRWDDGEAHEVEIVDYH